MTFKNRVKRMLKEGKKTSGAWLQIASPFTAEIMSRAGFDLLVIDMEHGPGDILTLVSQLQAMSGTDTCALVRTPWNDFVTIKRILDTGVHGLLIPYVNTKEEAEAAVQACRYPPNGIRGVAGSPRAQGFGQGVQDYLRIANEEILLITAVETPEAVANLDGILSVEGVDGIFIGPMDLATNMGYLGQPGQPKVQEVIVGIEKKVFAAGKTLATIAGTWEQAQKLYEKGYQMITLMADGTSLAKLAAINVAHFKENFPKR
ncbi:MAG: 2,4-dihydroxyhept-2-ene-1,7-dioic acid aldolase [Chloroflexi bacterium]|nr:MAG: 2,4-dihydroxyhept-2-ene-1,7-dioic acid aldolase [Chloroflexota bacterium]